MIQRLFVIKSNKVCGLMGNYELSYAAKADLRRLYTYGILSFGEKLADEYFEGMIARFLQIADMPKLYPAVDDIKKGYRRCVFGSHSIYYKIADNHVKIIRILSREDPKRAL